MLGRARQAIAGRLKRVCEHLEEQDFQSLIARMAEIEIKYAMRRDDAVPARGRSPLPTADDGPRGGS
jgi:hypothetical protein